MDDPRKAPDQPVDLTISFDKGIPAKLSVEGKEYTDGLELFVELNRLGKLYGIGRIDIVEDRFVGLKSRGCYDSPAMTILREAHLDAEGLVMDGRLRALRDQFVSFHWNELLYNGLYFSPELEWIEGALISSQKRGQRRRAAPLVQGFRVCAGPELQDGEAVRCRASFHGLLDGLLAHGYERLHRDPSHSLEKVWNAKGRSWREPQ